MRVLLWAAVFEAGVVEAQMSQCVDVGGPVVDCLTRVFGAAASGSPSLPITRSVVPRGPAAQRSGYTLDRGQALAPQSRSQERTVLIGREIDLLRQLARNLPRNDPQRPEVLRRLGETLFDQQQAIHIQVRTLDAPIFQATLVQRMVHPVRVASPPIESRPLSPRVRAPRVTRRRTQPSRGTRRDPRCSRGIDRGHANTPATRFLSAATNL